MIYIAIGLCELRVIKGDESLEGQGQYVGHQLPTNLNTSVVRLRVHFEFGHFSNWAFYSEHCKHMRLIRNDLS